MGLPRILVLSLGGTWNMTWVSDPATGIRSKKPQPVGEVRLEELFPALAILCTVELSEPFSAIDSSNMAPTHWTDTATVLAEARDSYDGFVVLQ